MLEERSLNFCDISHLMREEGNEVESLMKDAMQLAGLEQVNRLYIGSYFCGNYFIRLDMELVKKIVEYCRINEKNITLVIPILTQKNLADGKEKVKGILTVAKDLIDEIVVNDVGMLQWVNENCNVGIQIGRLLMKDYRDPRYPEYFSETLVPKIFGASLTKLMNQYRVTGLEFDPTHTTIDLTNAPEQLTLSVHEPYCYITVGQICEYASIFKENSKKFRPNDDCKLECESTLITYHIEDGRRWVRIGRAMLFENRECNVLANRPYRHIFFPIDLEVRG